MDGMHKRLGRTKSKSETPDCVTVRRCRICGEGDLAPILDLGRTPLANSFLSSTSEEERFYPLTLRLCRTCSLVQLGEVVSPDIMFREYPYRTASSVTVPSHFRELARYVSTLLSRSRGVRAYEVGS